MNKEIIIIGAGASGLTAARRLSAAGYRVLVLEAAAVAGGRMRNTDNVFSFPVEAGAEFVHGDLPYSLELAKEAGVRLVPLASSMVRLAKGEGIKQRGGSSFLSTEWDELMDAMEKLEVDVPMADFMAEHFSGERYEGLRVSVRRFGEGYDLADLQRVSTKALYAEWAREGEDEEYRPEGGYRPLIDFLIGEIHRHGGEVLLSCPVAGVVWRAGRVDVTVADGRVFTAAQLLTTVSLGILQQEPMPIRFSPDIPDHLQAARQLGYGSVIKILLEWKERFWAEEEYKGKTLFIISEEAVPTWWTQNSEVPLLTGWLAGEKMQDFQKLGAEEQLESCLRSLASIFSVKMELLHAQLKQVQILDWEKDPYVRGGYSYEVVDANSYRERLSQPVERTLFFAGEALYAGIAPGTVEAAFESGWKAAEEIKAAASGE